MAFQGFGTPGRPRKSIRDNKFEFVQSTGAARTPCKVAQSAVGTDIRDGRFLAIDANGDYVAAADAARSVRMIFTGDTMRMHEAYHPTGTYPDYNQAGAPDAEGMVYPGADPSDTVTGWMGDIEAIWPAGDLMIGAAEAAVSVNDFGVNDPVTVKNGRLAKAAVGDTAIGYVTATANTLGAPAVQAAIRIL